MFNLISTGINRQNLIANNPRWLPKKETLESSMQLVTFGAATFRQSQRSA